MDFPSFQQLLVEDNLPLLAKSSLKRFSEMWAQRVGTKRKNPALVEKFLLPYFTRWLLDPYEEATLQGWLTYAIRELTSVTRKLIGGKADRDPHSAFGTGRTVDRESYDFVKQLSKELVKDQVLSKKFSDLSKFKRNPLKEAVSIASFFEKDYEGKEVLDLFVATRKYKKTIPLLYELLMGDEASEWITDWLYKYQEEGKEEELRNQLHWFVNQWIVPFTQAYNRTKLYLKNLGRRLGVGLVPEDEKSIAGKIKTSIGSYFSPNGWKSLMDSLYVNVASGQVEMGLLYNATNRKLEEFEMIPFDEYNLSDQEDYQKVIQAINILTGKKGRVRIFYSSQPRDKIEKILRDKKLFNGMYVADSRQGADKYWVIEQDRAIAIFDLDDMNAVNLGSGEYIVMGNPQVRNIRVVEH